jgi:myo-inositol-1-phosphate synthase
MKAAFDHNFVKLIDGPNIKKGKNKYEWALEIKDDIAEISQVFAAPTRLVTCWCGSTESFLKPSEVHSTPDKFRGGDEEANHPAIAPVDAVRVGLGDQRRAVRKWRAKFERGHSGDSEIGPRQ